MQKIKVNHEVPRSLLSSSYKFNDYDFILPHLLDQDEEYLQHFLDAKRKGRYIIMDNSLHLMLNVKGVILSWIIPYTS